MGFIRGTGANEEAEASCNAAMVLNWSRLIVPTLHT